MFLPTFAKPVLCVVAVVYQELKLKTNKKELEKRSDGIK
jgi:hypothetical protein